MARFDRQIATALRLIKKNGRSVNWRQVRDTVADPSQPWKTGESEIVDNTVTICFLPVDRDTYKTLAFRFNGEIPSFSQLGYMGAVNFDPNLKDVVIRDGEELRIAYIDKLAPNGQNILYTVLFQ